MNRHSHSQGCLCNYVECVGPSHRLNPGPHYKVGEIWQSYGGFNSGDYKIVLVGDHNIVTEHLPSGDLYSWDWRNNERYANCGTPQLRIKIKDAQELVTD